MTTQPSQVQNGMLLTIPKMFRKSRKDCRIAAQRVVIPIYEEAHDEVSDALNRDAHQNNSKSNLYAVARTKKRRAELAYMSSLVQNLTIPRGFCTFLFGVYMQLLIWALGQQASELNLQDLVQEKF